MKTLSKIINLLNAHQIDVTDMSYDKRNIRISDSNYFEQCSEKNITTEIDCLSDVNQAYFENHWLVIELKPEIAEDTTDENKEDFYFVVHNNNQNIGTYIITEEDNEFSDVKLVSGLLNEEDVEAITYNSLALLKTNELVIAFDSVVGDEHYINQLSVDEFDCLTIDLSESKEVLKMYS